MAHVGRCTFGVSDGSIVESLGGERIAEVPFTYRSAGHREIVIETVKNGAVPLPQLEVGGYRFEIRVEHRRMDAFYMLRFEREFFGAPLSAYGQKVDVELNPLAKEYVRLVFRQQANADASSG